MSILSTAYLIGFLTPGEILLGSLVPLLIAGALFYFGYKRAQKKVAGQDNPSLPEIARHAAVFWIIGVVVAAFPAMLILGGIFAALFG